MEKLVKFESINCDGCLQLSVLAIVLLFAYLFSLDFKTCLIFWLFVLFASVRLVFSEFSKITLWEQCGFYLVLL